MPPPSVTPEEVVTAILMEFEKSAVPFYYSNCVRNVFCVYLHRDDYSNLRPFQNRIREEAVRALEESLRRLNEPRKSALPFQRTARQKRYEALGDWRIEFLPNEDEEAEEQRLIVHSDGPPPSPVDIEGTATVRVGQPVLDDGLTKTKRTGYPAPAASNAVCYARLSFEDDSGPHEFDIVKDTVKVGRGGPEVWVDVKLLASNDVSREHFQIRRDAAAGKFFIKDMSRFGTWVNGSKIPPSVQGPGGAERDANIEVPLPPKASITLADVLTMRFRALNRK